MIRAVGVEQEIASVIGSLAPEAAYKGVTSDQHLRWLEGDLRHRRCQSPGGADGGLMPVARAQETYAPPGAS
jgi:hypothetical protein